MLCLLITFLPKGFIEKRIINLDQVKGRKSVNSRNKGGKKNTLKNARSSRSI